MALSKEWYEGYDSYNKSLKQGYKEQNPYHYHLQINQYQNWENGYSRAWSNDINRNINHD